MVQLSKIGDRDKLQPRKGDEPHWQPLRQGCYAGFRPSKRGGKGAWFARAYDLDQGRYVFLDPIASVKLDKLRRHHLRDW